nr:HMG1/2-like protein isoform X2 [Nicotiana tomentosiformis]
MMHIAWKKKRKKDKTIDSSRKSKKVRMEPIELSDSEEESDDPSSGSKDGEKICYSHSGGRSDAKADNTLSMKNKALRLKLRLKTCAEDPEKTKRPTSAFYVRRRWRSAKDPDKPKRPSAFLLFMEEFKKQFMEENPNKKYVFADCKAGGYKWSQLSDADKAPYITEARKRKAEYRNNMDVYIRREAERRKAEYRYVYSRQLAAGSAEEEEADKSRSEVDEEEGSGEEDKKEDDN